MKKKMAALFLAAAMLLSLAACGGDTPSGGDGPDAQQGQSGTDSGGAQAEKFENKIALSIDKAAYDKEERVEVTMDFADVDQDNAIIVIVSADMAHGELTPAEESCEEYRWIADFSEIPFFLFAPDQDGLFDVRVYASGSGEELASVSFAVGSAALPDSSGDNSSGDNSTGGAGAGDSSDGGAGGILTEGGDCTQKQMEETIVSYLSALGDVSSLTLGGGSRIEYTKAGDALNDFDFWTIYDPTLDNEGMYEALNSQLTAAGFTYEEDMVGRHVWYVDEGGAHKGILFWPDDDEMPDGYYILMMTYAAN